MRSYVVGTIRSHFCGIHRESDLWGKSKDLKMTASDLTSIRLAARDTQFIDIDEKKEPLRKEGLSVTSPDLPEALFACMKEVCK